MNGKKRKYEPATGGKVTVQYIMDVGMEGDEIKPLNSSTEMKKIIKHTSSDQQLWGQNFDRKSVDINYMGRE